MTSARPAVDLDGYRVLGELARGAQHVLLKVAHPTTQEEMALKLFTGCDARALERFRREAKVLARAAGHPNIVRLQGSGECEGRPYHVTELLRGPSVAQLLRGRGALPWQEACAIAWKVASALEHMHRWGVVHRGLTPAGIVVEEPGGEPRIADLGLAVDLDLSARVTQQGEALGETLFAAPEQLRGSHDEVGPRTDVYALGATLYAMLTGRPPFRAGSLRELHEMSRAGPPESPDRVVPGVPEAVASICLRALSARSEDRHESARALEKDLAAQLRAQAPTDTAIRGLRIDLPPYEVLGPIGQGGMGVVYEARAPGGAEVAIKVLRTLTASARARFERERRLLASLGDAEGFVPLLDSGVRGDQPYVVMPLIRGGTLGERLRKGPLGVDAVIALGRDLASALARAHGRGIVHRDLKPDNVLFAPDGRPLIADLGLAKHFEEEASSGLSLSLTRAGDALGTPGFMAPEQIGDAKAVGPAADVFALGAILYECLSGKPAFPGTVIERLVNIARGRRAPVALACPEAPAWLALVVERALAVETGTRFRDGAELRRALDAGPDEALARSRRRRARGIVLGAVVLVAALAPGFVLLRRQQARALAASGHEKLLRGDLDGALDDLGAAIDLEPDASESLRDRGLAELRRGRLEAALADLSRAIELDPASFAAWLGRAEARAAGRDDEGAIRDFSRAIELDPGAAVARLGRGLARERRGDYAGAGSDLSKAIELDGRSARAQLHHALVRRRHAEDRDGNIPKTEIDGIVAELTTAIGLDPESDEAYLAHTHRAVLYSVLHQYEMAINDALRATSLKLDFADAWTERAIARVGRAMGRADKRPELGAAIDEASQAIALRPGSRAYSIRGIARQASGDLAGAMEDFKHALEMAPGDWRNWNVIANAHVAHGDDDDAIRETTRAIELKNDAKQAWLNRGIARARKVEAALREHAPTVQDDLALAIADLRQFLSLAPEEAEASRARARIAQLEALARR